MREADDLATFMCRMSWKSGSLNLLEPSGPHRACYGTTLFFTITVKVKGMRLMWLGCVLAGVSCGHEVVCTRQKRTLNQ
jgi:hypothetical protein